MKFTVLIVLMIFSSVSVSIQSPGTISVGRTESFLVYIKGTNTTLSSCTAHYGNNTISLDLSSSNVEVISDFRDDSDLLKRITSLGRGLCGFKLTNSSTSDPMEWKLTAEDDNNTYSDTYKIQHYGTESNLHTVKEAILGIGATIKCEVSLESYFCDIYNPKGVLVSSSMPCEYYLKTVSLSDVGTWRCITGTKTQINTLEYTVDVVLTAFTSVENWVTEDDAQLSFGCAIKNPTGLAPKYCEMTSPSGDRFEISENKATSRYTTVKTDLAAHKCGIEIQKPLDISEHGLWKCKISDYGTILTIGNIIKKESEKHLSASVQLGETFVIKCEVPYSAIYCHVTSPNGTKYTPDKPTRTGLGECFLTVKVASESDNGTWTCSFAKENTFPDEIIEYDILIAETLSYPKSVEVAKNAEVELICRSGGLPLQYCRFMSPSGQWYHMHKHLDSSDIMYAGKGIEYGDCGIRIYSTKDEDFGNWTCVTRIGENYKEHEITGKILLTSAAPSSIFSDTNLAQSLGIGFGALFVIAALGGFVLFKRLKKPANDDNEVVVFNRPSEDSNTDESMVSTHFVGYDSTVNVENQNEL